MNNEPEAELSLALLEMLSERKRTITETATRLRKAMLTSESHIANISRSPRLKSTPLVVVKRALERNVLKTRRELNTLLESAMALALSVALSEAELEMIRQEEQLIAKDKQTYKEEGLYRGAVSFITKLHTEYGIWHANLDGLSAEQIADIAAIIGRTHP
jgi:hypothetical protein